MTIEQFSDPALPYHRSYHQSLPPNAQSSDTPLAARELAAEIQRTPDHVLRFYVRPMLAQGRLERVGAAPTDPHVRYRAAGGG
jgi:hypothetical protein